METKHQVFNLIILDESGSMGRIKDATISGFNELVQTTKAIEKKFPDQFHTITFISFNSEGIKTILFNEPASKIEEINAEKYHPAQKTPLYDAMGMGISMIRKETAKCKDYHVLVTVLTDGMENASVEYKGSQISEMVEELSGQNWTFTYMGANHDVEKFALSLSITNSLHFHANEEDIKRLFKKESHSRIAYSKKISKKQNTRDGYFTKDSSSKKKN